MRYLPQQHQLGTALSIVNMASACSKDIGQAVWGNIFSDPIPLSTGSTVPCELSAGPSNPALLDSGTALPGYALRTLTDSQWARSP